MTLAPAFEQKLFAIFGMKAHVHGEIRVMNVTDLALTTCLNSMSCEKPEAVLLYARAGGAVLLGALEGEFLEGAAEGLEAVWGALLVDLPVRRDACHLGFGPDPVGELVLSEDALGWQVARSDLGGCEGISDGPETEPGDAHVAAEGGRCSSRTQVQVVLIVMLNIEYDWDESHHELGDVDSREVHEGDESQGRREDCWAVEGKAHGRLLQQRG